MHSRYDNLLAGKNQVIRTQWAALGVVSMSALIMGVGWLTAPKDLRIHIPPDLAAGATLRPDQAGRADVYTFAHYIWQQLYRWERDAATDYEDQIHRLQNYLTPRCFQDRLDDANRRAEGRELERRQRSVREIPGRGYAENRVREHGSGTWTVSLDLHLTETLLGETVKERLVHYPLRVVRYAVDPEKNPWGLAIDCLAATPRVIETVAS